MYDILTGIIFVLGIGILLVHALEVLGRVTDRADEVRRLPQRIIARRCASVGGLL